MGLRAIVYLAPGPDADQRAARCAEYCRRRGYQLAAVVIGDTDGHRWSEVHAMALRGEVGVVVVGSRTELPPGRVPRIEPLTSEIPAVPTQRMRRPRLLRGRDGGGAR